MSTLKSSAEHLTLNADGSGNDIKFQSNATEVAAIDQSGNLTLSGTVDGVDIQTLNTTAGAALPKAGGTMTGDTLHGDNVKAKFGTAPDLEIYHDGSHSIISDIGAGGLKVKASDVYIRSTSDADMIHATSGGYVKLYNNGSEKLATTSTGIDVTGTVTADGIATNSIGTSNLRLGLNAGDALNTSGALANTFIGDESGGAVTTGSNNTFSGKGSGSLVTSGGNNTIVGRYDGNQHGVDVRTTNNTIVLSDGDGHPSLIVYPANAANPRRLLLKQSAAPTAYIQAVSNALVIGHSRITVASGSTTNLVGGYTGSLTWVFSHSTASHNLQYTWLVSHAWSGASVIWSQSYGGATTTWTFSASSGVLRVHQACGGPIDLTISTFIQGSLSA